MGKGKLYIVGIGPGSPDYTLPTALKVLEGCDVLIGGKRNLQGFKHLNKETLLIGSDLSQVSGFIEENITNKSIGVIASGDTGVFSILGFLKKELPHLDPEVIPGISSFQYLCAKTSMGWEDAMIVSAHGREIVCLEDIIRKKQKVILFTGGKTLPRDICRRLCDSGLGNINITVGENLSYEGERIISGTARELREASFGGLSIMLLINPHTEEKIDSGSKEAECPWHYATPGIPDNTFIRGDVPMTKEEVRAITISKLRLNRDSTVFDIGAGTGSVSVECSLMCPQGRIYAVEKEEEGIELINRNAQKFGLTNIIPVKGEAPQALPGLPSPDRVFLGGTGGRMEEVLDYLNTVKAPLRVVVNAVTLETSYEAVKGLRSRGFKNIEVVNISISKGLEAGDKTLMKAQNPVFIISGDKTHTL